MADLPISDPPVSDPPVSDPSMIDGRVTVVVSGPGHHDRADAAADLIGHLTALGRVGVHAELRPRLAADVEALLDAGAGAVRLAGSRVVGVFRDRAGGAVHAGPADAGRADAADRADTGRADVADRADTGRADAADRADAGPADAADRADELVDVEIVVELVASPQPIAATVVSDAGTEPSPRVHAVQEAVAAWSRARGAGDPG